MTVKKGDLVRMIPRLRMPSTEYRIGMVTETFWGRNVAYDPRPPDLYAFVDWRGDLPGEFPDLAADLEPLDPGALDAVTALALIDWMEEKDHAEPG